MKNKILKLCKRLNKATVKEIAPLVMLQEAEVSNYLNELVQENKLIVGANSIYFYKENATKYKLPVFFEYRDKEVINFLVQSFCCEISTAKVSWLTKIREPVICRFYSYFREVIYTKQLQELQNYFDKNPQIPCIRQFVGGTVYMYYYNNQTYVSKNKLISEIPQSHFDKQDMIEFKKDYSKLTRKVNHNSMLHLLHFHLSEQIFRFNHSYDEVYDFLKNMLNI